MKKYSFLSLIFFCFMVLKSEISRAESILIKGAKTPDLVVETLGGETFDLKKNHGKIVIVNFWAYWCRDCLREMLVLEELYQQYKEQGLEIIGVDIDKTKEIKDVLNRVSKVTYPNAMLINAKINNFSQVETVPTTYIFDRNGVLKKIITSFEETDKDALEKELLPLLK